ncbi:putative molybdopterin biosynthesis protein MoeA/LysR substrate binding-domain-containing protein [Thalassovita gelatinovora]|uniref:Putative molybdopterin biosynthesis protein MoeA/LysR substrate binding-domain-containing protein n=1 Tax=Thalassovita gelatinovora TaxID=53501 RepID=A0A0P1FK42_THAGE|nr:molybdopterin-binding protein [Thalassovita gelatinovora]QIZ82363.1 molybdopterin-binding protein [Thalassovita gelatinovora]CUH68432.1 putative molybdopterin biosynthesis protein MoeA/LysR substrate binding-domain-containing protein [Thalassovita gelatinovora]SEQ51992.1 molybdenum cofactor cytidylyltransferase [Thalassovita gelatinovora]
MRFGPVPIGQAEGAILAHSVSLNGKRMRKGVVLSANDIAALRGAGIAEVTVARLEPDDIHEDTAAEALARSLVPDPDAAGLRLSKPFTGRVNITADGPGVVVMDQERLVALNAIDPMITLATVPPFQQMTTGGMVGTVKIISYGVAQSDVEQACELGAGALRLARPVCCTASLIITDIPGGAGDKGRKAIEARVSMLGMSMCECGLIPHREEDLAAAIAAATGDLVMILTGSATSDAHDVAPQALRRAGGRVERFGMPVDPGNLLFLGDLGDRPVIGLPGCARSPALNGADWVLSRVACGLSVSAADIAAMGVGGLLKEIPTRPMPRAGRKG